MVEQMESQIRHLKLSPEERSAEILRTAQEGVKNAEESLQKVNDAIASVNEKKTQVLNDINSNFDELGQALEDRQTEIEQEVQTMADQYLDQFKVLIGEAETEFSEAKEYCDRLDNLSLDERLREDTHPCKTFDDIPDSDFQLKFICELSNA